MEDFLKSIGIDKEGTYSDDNCYVIDLEDSDDYGRYRSRLDRCDKLEEDEDTSLITVENSSIQYVNDKYTITLLGDFDGDKYSIICREN